MITGVNEMSGNASKSNLGPVVSNASYSPSVSLYKRGYVAKEKIASTLQGSVYKGIHLKSGESIVIKRTSVHYYKKNMGYFNGKYYKLNENIVEEFATMSYLNTLKLTQYENRNENININEYGMLKVIDFFQDKMNFYLITNYGGKSLFDHVKKFHCLIENNKLHVNEWKIHAKYLIKQICIFVHWLHQCHTCHLDISLENMLISECKFIEENGKYKFLNHGMITFIDFGLAKVFTDDNFTYSKSVGKELYQAPKVRNGETYDPRKADVWSLGVCLFAIVTGFAPFNKADKDCQFFQKVWKGELYELVRNFEREYYIPEYFLELCRQIFVTEDSRLTMNDILNSLYLQS